MSNTKTRLKELCDWHTALEAEESQYFESVDACNQTGAAVSRECIGLEKKLRENPAPALFRELAEKELLAAKLKSLAGEYERLFWTRRNLYDRRAVNHPAHRDLLRELASLALESVSDRLEKSFSNDEKLTRDIGAREPIVSLETRRLSSIRELAGKLQSALSGFGGAFGTDQASTYWQPASGLVASIMEDLK